MADNKPLTPDEYDAIPPEHKEGLAGALGLSMVEHMRDTIAAQYAAAVAQHEDDPDAFPEIERCVILLAPPRSQLLQVLLGMTFPENEKLGVATPFLNAEKVAALFETTASPATGKSMRSVAETLRRLEVPPFGFRVVVFVDNDIWVAGYGPPAEDAPPQPVVEVDSTAEYVEG